MLNALKKLFGIKAAEKAEVTQPEAAPYKVETVEAPTPAVETATQAMVESVAPAKKKPAAKKPAAKKARKPKTPKQS